MMQQYTGLNLPFLLLGMDLGQQVILLGVSEEIKQYLPKINKTLNCLNSTVVTFFFFFK